MLSVISRRRELRLVITQPKRDLTRVVVRTAADDSVILPVFSSCLLWKRGEEEEAKG